MITVLISLSNITTVQIKLWVRGTTYPQSKYWKRQDRDHCRVAVVNHIRASCVVLITILVWRHDSIHAKCVAINVWLSEAACVWGIPLVFNMCMWVQGFSETAWFLSHISRMERQSYYTMESCLHSTAASMVRLNGPGYSLDRPVTKPGMWFMGQFRAGRDPVLIHLPLLLALMAYSKHPYSEHLEGCTKIKFWFCGSLLCFNETEKSNKGHS